MKHTDCACYVSKPWFKKNKEQRERDMAGRSVLPFTHMIFAFWNSCNVYNIFRDVPKLFKYHFTKLSCIRCGTIKHDTQIGSQTKI